MFIEKETKTIYYWVLQYLMAGLYSFFSLMEALFLVFGGQEWG
jgi:hypothetical protein